MKHLKFTSALLAAVMCITMVMAPVAADETETPSEAQTTETEEENESEDSEESASNFEVPSEDTESCRVAALREDVRENSAGTVASLPPLPVALPTYVLSVFLEPVEGDNNEDVALSDEECDGLASYSPPESLSGSEISLRVGEVSPLT